MDLAQTFSYLSDDLATLKRMVEMSSPRFSCASFIPHVLRGQENNPVDLIEPAQHFGYEAISRSADAWNDLHIRQDFSQKAARRMPGVLWYQAGKDSSTDDMIRVLVRINETKSAIERYITGTFQSRTARFEALHNACPGVMTMHLYRQIRWWHDEDIAAVRFCWQEKDSLYTPDKNALLMKISSNGDSSADMSVPVEILFKKVLSVPEERLRVRRKIRVQPVANVTFHQGDDMPLALKTVTATMPFIVIQNRQPDFKMLDTFSAQNREGRKPRSDRANTEIIGTFSGETIEMVL